LKDSPGIMAERGQAAGAVWIHRHHERFVRHGADRKN
jgi:hypothetical protein